MAFLDDRYLLSGAESEALYERVRELPIIDAHNHCDVRALAEDRHFTDIWDAEASTDHYVWEVLRKSGVPEELLTGAEATNEEKWMAMAAAFEQVAGNPTYEWIHLDLKRVLGIDELITADTAADIWRRTRERLAQPDMSQQSLIEHFNVEAMCSTDDPVDSLEYHRRLQSSRLAGRVHPTFRPDRAMNVFKPDWADYVASLGQRWNMTLTHVRDLVRALQLSHDFFAENGCVASDHGVEVPYGYQVSESDADAVFRKALNRETLQSGERIQFMSYMLNELAEMDAQKNWVFQLHIGAVRDVRSSLYDRLGADVGGDISNHLTDYVTPLLPLLNRFDGRCRFVLYNMNPCHNATLAQLTRAFGGDVSLGLAWWLNDSYYGMRTQLEYASTVDTFANMAGMVSDSRKILSYGSRHEMFRRTLCSVLGAEVARGQMPMAAAERLAVRLSYERPKALFGL